MAIKPADDPYRACAERLAKLEKENRRLRLAVIALFVVMGCGAIAAFTPRKQTGVTLQPVTAREFVLSDALGRTRATLAINQGGSPELDMYGADGGRRVALGAVNGSSELELLDAQGSGRALLGDTITGQAALQIYDRRGQRLNLGLGADKQPALDVYDSRGVSRVEVGVGADGSPILELYGALGNTVWRASPRP